jgi:hypothetical protein
VAVAIGTKTSKTTNLDNYPSNYNQTNTFEQQPQPDPYSNYNSNTNFDYNTNRELMAPYGGKRIRTKKTKHSKRKSKRRK